MPGSPHRDLVVERRAAFTDDGWRLELKRTVAPGALVPGTRPLLIVPGYGMNAFIFGFHPRGTSLERCLAEAGFEVWSANLRGMGGSRGRPGAPGPSIEAYARQDLPALVRAVLAQSGQGAALLDLIGCSLGGSVVYAYLALAPDAPVAALATMGAPLRWVEVHPAVRAAFSSPWLAGRLVLRGTRTVARSAAGLVRRFPGLLSIYLNPAHVDLAHLEAMTETVEDPHPRVNADLARWIAGRDLVVEGVNVYEALAAGRAGARPLLLVVANRDGIVPVAVNLSARAAWTGGEVQVVRVGDEQDWYAHADLFVGHDSERAVFAPLVAWLRAKNSTIVREAG